MVAFNLADSYRAAGLTTGPEILQLRKEPCAKLMESMDARHAINLVRLYFEIPVPEGIDWFLEAFRESDPSFSLYENQREATVLAAALLEAAITNGNIFAALALLTGAAGGARKPPEREELLDFAKQAIRQHGVRERDRQNIDIGQIKKAPASKLFSDLPAVEAHLLEGPSKQAQLFKQAYNETQQATNSLVSQAVKVLSSEPVP